MRNLLASFSFSGRLKLPSTSTQLGQITKTRQKWLIKFVKLTGFSYACNSLTWHPFEYEEHAMTGIGNQVNFLKLPFKNSWNNIKNLFLAGLSHLEPLCSIPNKECKRPLRAQLALRVVIVQVWHSTLG